MIRTANAKPSIWMDVTDLANWRGSLTGIQRTVFHLGEEAAKLSEIRFFQFSAPGAFEEVDFPAHPHETERRLERDETREGGRRPFALRRDMKRVLKAAGRRTIPVGLRARVLGRARRINDFVFSNPAAAVFSMTEVAIPTHPFAPGDTVVVLGASWGTAGLNDALYRLRKACDIRLVSMVYDLIPVYFPHYFGAGFASHYANYLLDLMHSTDRIIAISESTATDLRRYAKDLLAPQKPIDVIRLGDDPVGLEPSEKPDNFDFNAGFILSVGTIEVRKNHLSLYRAWSLAADRGIELPPLVIVGRPGWLSSEFCHSIEEDPRVRGRIVIFSGLDDGALEWLYKNCLFTIYPSWYEGWGLPIAESLNHGKVCVASDTSSMVEIGGELVRHISPHDIEGILSEVILLSNDTVLRSELEQAIVDGYKPFTWAQSATQLLEILKKEAV